jgi:hypothetical protein
VDVRVLRDPHMDAGRASRHALPLWSHDLFQTCDIVEKRQFSRRC